MARLMLRSIWAQTVALRQPSPANTRRSMKIGGARLVVREMVSVELCPRGRHVRSGNRRADCCLAQDITERKEAEIHIQELADQLRRFSTRLESAREEERIHIAREIHDELGQALTALKMDLSDINRQAHSCRITSGTACRSWGS